LEIIMMWSRDRESVRLRRESLLRRPRAEVSSPAFRDSSRQDMVEVLEKRARRLKEFMRVAPGRFRQTTTNMMLIVLIPCVAGR
jgi:hypothetical protein